MRRSLWRRRGERAALAGELQDRKRKKEREKSISIRPEAI